MTYDLIQSKTCELCNRQDEIVNQTMSELSESNYCTVVKKVKKDNVTPDNIGEIILCQIPGISSVTAMAIMKHFKTFPNLIEELQKNSQCIENLTIQSNGKIRKINKSSIENIKQYLLGYVPTNINHIK